MFLDKTDITSDILIDRLIEETKVLKNGFWSRKDYTSYFEYSLKYEISNGVNLLFKIHNYKIHDSHILIVYLQRNHRYTTVINTNNQRLIELISTINKLKCFHIDNSY